MKLHDLAITAALVVGTLSDHKTCSLIINLLNGLSNSTSTIVSFDHSNRRRHNMALLINLGHLWRIVLANTLPVRSFDWWLIHWLHFARFVGGFVVRCWHFSRLMLSVVLGRFVVADSLGDSFKHRLINIHWNKFIALFLASCRSHGLFFLNNLISKYFRLNLLCHYWLFISL